MTNEATTPSGQPLGISHKPSKSGAMFTKFKAENKPAFIGYLPYGFPNPDVSLDAFKTMVEHGVDAVEIGLPYSDPVMDGPVIQAAASIALNNGETIKRVFEAVETVANAGGVPLIMSYWNLVYHYGVERFARDFENAGGAGLITPDLIPDEAGSGSKPPTATDSTASSWSPRTRPPSASKPWPATHVASCTRPPAWASPANAPPSTPRPNSSWNVPVRPVPRTCAWASACPPPNRAPRSAPTRTASSSAPRSCTPCSRTTTRPHATRRKA